MLDEKSLVINVIIIENPFVGRHVSMYKMSRRASQILSPRGAYSISKSLVR